MKTAACVGAANVRLLYARVLDWPCDACVRCVRAIVMECWRVCVCVYVCMCVFSLHA